MEARKAITLLRAYETFIAGYASTVFYHPAPAWLYLDVFQDAARIMRVYMRVQTRNNVPKADVFFCYFTKRILQFLNSENQRTNCAVDKDPRLTRFICLDIKTVRSSLRCAKYPIIPLGKVFQLLNVSPPTPVLYTDRFFFFIFILVDFKTLDTVRGDNISHFS